MPSDKDKDKNLGFKDMDFSNMSNLEMQKHLYETGLQNVFNDYQQNIERLSQQEQQSIQDAYVVKEMSKKYLGKYAANTGIGDVSGDLLDIYGNYQSSINEINQNFAELEIGLQQQYQQQRNEMLHGLMETRYNIEQEELSMEVESIISDITTGNTDGKDPFVYLEENREILGEKNYRALYASLYEEQLEEVSTNLQQGYYGMVENEDGEMVRSNDPYEYLQQFKGVLNTSHYNMLKGSIQNPVHKDLAFKIARNDFGDHESGFDYLDAIKDELSEEEYIQYYQAIRDNVVNEMSVRAETNTFGFVGEGENRREKTAEEYLQSVEDRYGKVLENDLEFNFYKEQIEHNEGIREEADAQESQAKLAENVRFNVMSGKTGDIDGFEYLEKHKEELGDNYYQMIYSDLYEQTLEEVSTNLQQGYYGDLDDPFEYLDQYKDILNPSHYNMLKGGIEDPTNAQIAMNIMRQDYGDYDSGFEYLESEKEELSDQEYMEYYSLIRDNVINKMRVRAENHSFGFEGEGDERQQVSPQQFIDEMEEKYGDVLANDLEFNFYKEQIETNMGQEAEFEEEVQRAELAEEVLFNVSTGNIPEGQDTFEYIEQYEGKIDDVAYREIHTRAYDQVLEEVSTNLQQGYYGGEDNGFDYIEKYKDIFNTSHYNMLKGSIQEGPNQDVAFNIMKGDFQGYDTGFEYLESEKEELSDEEYIQYYQAIRERALSEIQVRAENHSFGFVGEGDERREVTAEEYLNEIDSKYGEYLKDDLEFNFYREQIETNKNIMEEQEDFAEYHSVREETIIDKETGEEIPNPSYDPDLDITFHSLFTQDNFSNTSNVYSIEGQNYVQTDVPVDEDDYGWNKYGVSYQQIDSSSLSESFYEKYGVPPHDGKMFVDDSGFVFMRERGNWYRMERLSDADMLPNDSQMALWNSNNSDQGILEINTRKTRSDEVTINGEKYTSESSSRSWGSIPQGARKAFEDVHGVNVNDHDLSANEAVVVYHDGEFYLAKGNMNPFNSTPLFYKLEKE